MKLKKIFSIALVAALTVTGALTMTAEKSSAITSVERLWGVDRIKTAEYVANSLNRHLNISDVAPSDEPLVVVLANKDSFADCLSAYNIMNMYPSKKARFLMIKKDYANIGLMKNYYKAEKIYLVGDYTHLTPVVEEYIKKNIKCPVIRVGGKDIYETNRESLKVSGHKTVGVADGRNFPDALGATGLLNQKNYGLMLVKGDEPYTVPAGLNVAYTFGGTQSVKQDGGERIAGANRFLTGLEVAKRADNPSAIIFVNGDKFPDSMSAINLLKPDNGVIMPISNTKSNDFAFNFAYHVNKGVFIGGNSSLSPQTIENIAWFGPYEAPYYDSTRPESITRLLNELHSVH